MSADEFSKCVICGWIQRGKKLSKDLSTVGKDESKAMALRIIWSIKMEFHQKVGLC